MWGNIVQDQLGVSQNKCQVLTNQLSNSTNLLYTAAAAQEESAVNDQFIKEVTLLNGSEDWDRHIKLKFLLASRSFALATCKQAWRKFEEFKEDEDTTVHVWLHDLLTEVFHGDNLYICWANGESASSRQPMKAYERSRSTGKKPDFGVFQYRSETVFGEFKRFGVASDSNAGVVDFLKVAVFLVGSRYAVAV
ncbi:hypothetical protein DFS34DRAFT_620542 [Phlyctochytrium arcticum]|nr:hypothetical protein DFS34DRAFT_620542 [Phlyctochytrium arcticum]